MLRLQHNGVARFHGAADQSAERIVGIAVEQITRVVLHLIELPVAGVGVSIAVAGGGRGSGFPPEIIVGVADRGAVAVGHAGQQTVRTTGGFH